MDSGKYEYHCQSSNQQLDRNNFQRNGHLRKSIACERNCVKIEKPLYNTLRAPKGSFYSQQFVYQTSSHNRNGYEHWPVYATVQNRQRQHRASILPPGMITNNIGQDNDGIGGTIRRFASIQLRSKNATAPKGRKLRYINKYYH